MCGIAHSTWWVLKIVAEGMCWILVSFGRRHPGDVAAWLPPNVANTPPSTVQDLIFFILVANGVGSMDLDDASAVSKSLLFLGDCLFVVLQVLAA